jgi:hypothetical protein
MPRIIKEPFAPRRRHLIFGSCGKWNGGWWFALQRTILGVLNLTKASREDICMVVLLACLLLTTLVWPWIVL